MATGPEITGASKGWFGDLVDYMKKQKPEVVLLFVLVGFAIYWTVTVQPADRNREEAARQKERDDFAVVNKEQRGDLLKHNEAQQQAFTDSLERVAERIERAK